MLFTNSIKADFLGVFAAFLAILVVWHIWALNYWKRKGILGPKPVFLFGNMRDFFLGSKSIGECFRDAYFEYKAQGKRYLGFFITGQAHFVPIDLELVKSILQTDFPNFHSHGTYYNEEDDPLSSTIFNLDGPKWKNVRVKLTPTFTSGKMKMMHQTLLDCSYGLKDLFAESENGPIEIKEIMARFTTDVIGSCVFGLDINSMKNPDSDFRKYGSLIFSLDPSSFIRFVLTLIVPHSFLRMVKFQGQKPQVTNFFYNIVLDTIKYREENNITRKDFMDMMIKMKNSKDENEKLSVNEIAAQCFLFFLAGFETSATTMNFICYELAVNGDIQQKVRDEINAVLSKHNNELTYDAVMEMEYLDKVVQEALRKHPPLPITIRKCTKSWQIPGESIVIDEGTNVMLPILAIHHDPEYYPDPAKFDPERFSEENKRSRPAFSYLPFGEGPRICIGLRFGVLQAKIGIITLIRNYKISLNKKTITPLRYNKILITNCVGGIWLDLKKI